MKNQDRSQIPVELMKKLEKWATSELTKEELAVLNAVLGVYYLGMQKKSVVLKEYPEYLQEITKAPVEEAVLPFITPVTPTTTTTTITTTIASHPIITCKKG